MRNAIRKGFKASEYELYSKTIQENDHIGWNKTEITWARKQTDTTLKRLSEFSSIRALDFCDFLLDVQEPVYRTDRLMQEHNKLTSPGRKISTEDKFEEFLDAFMKYQLNKHIEAEAGEDLMVVDEVSNLLKLNKQSITSLHQARLARNWVSHKESEQKIAPRWKYVEITLTYAQQLSEIKN